MSKVTAPERAKQAARPSVGVPVTEDHPPSEAPRRAGTARAAVAGGLPSLQTNPITPGLVPSDTTARVVPLTLERQSDSVAVAARSFGATPWSSLAEESPLPRLKIAPGVLLLTRTSVAQEVRAAELEHVRQVAKVNVAGQFLAEDPDWRLGGLPGREVTEWSGKSRANMVKTFAALDWSPVVELDRAGRVPAMVTLTYPAAWEVVAPDGKTVKRHVRVFQRRYLRAWGESIIGAWKLEFQGRGAPHVHIFMAPPHGRARGRGVGAGLSFTHWLSAVWADVVDHPDAAEYMKHLAAGTGVDHAEALKCSDPKRLAVYFGKHGQYRDKEYQNQVPELWQAPGAGPGRFWGYWGLKLLVAPVELRPDDYVLAARILRRYAERVRVWDKAAGEWKYVRAMYGAKGSYAAVDYSTGEIGWRKHRRRTRVRRFGSCSGFLLVNDGPAMATQLARAIEVCRK
jgi:hypothetical protein